ncbi:MAG: MoaD/ThiS family protein [Burkholderiales bacterium]|nr:MoaD/ThiS family protein [Burkholderiales bacterium]
MPSVAFTHHLRRIAPTTPVAVPGETVRAALVAVFETYPEVASYVLDEQGGLRKHVAIFIDGELCRNPLAQTVSPDASIYVMQALSGG